MKLLPEILLLTLFFFLYLVFVYAKDNFILLRKNITLEYLFNISIVGFLVSIFFARVGYVIEHVSTRYYNPLVFFLFPYFPGLSVAGGIIGFTMYIFFATKQKKIPFWNIFDIFSLSLFFSFCFGELLYFMVNVVFQRTYILAELVGAISLILLFFLCSLFYAKNTFRDGSLGFLLLSLLVLVQAIVQLMMRGKSALTYSHFTIEDIALGILFFLYVILFVHRQVFQKK